MVVDEAEVRMAGRAGWLVSRRAGLDRGEAAWLAVLADFDVHQEWACDGQLSCVDWLMWRAAMSRATAFEKVRVAHQLRRRPAVADAFAAGRISYSAVRAITRIDRPDPAVDDALIHLAAVGSVRDVERAVRHYQLCADQERDPADIRHERRGVRLHRGWDGLGRADVILDDIEIEEFDAVLRAFMNRADRTDRADRTESAAPSVDESRRRDVPDTGGAGADVSPGGGG